MTRRPRALATIMVALAIVFAQEVSRRVLAAAFEGSDLVAPERLSDTGLDEARPFSPQYPLWSDGAIKRRWVSLPPGSTIDVTDVNAWDFPVGTRFWKEFAFEGRKVETRFLWKASAERWVFASYAWNEAGTDARRAPEDGVPAVARIGGRAHSIPSIVECRSCHDTRRTEILGFNALQLSTDRDPNAIHGEPLAPGMITLQTLVDEGRLSPARPDLVTNPPRIITESAATRAVLGYLAANCGACHNADGELASLGPSLKHGDVARDGDRAVRSLLRQPTTWQVPGLPEGASVLIDPEAPQSSAMVMRMRSRRPSSQMPPTGTAIPDHEAIDAITRWIRADVQPLHVP